MSKLYALETRKLTKSYGSIKAVDQIDIKVPFGKTYGLLGPNGAGKTTLIRILNCIVKPTSGTALVDSFDIRECPQKIKSICGLLPEKPSFYKRLTPVEFLEFVGKLYELSNQEIERQTKALLKIFDLEERSNYRIQTFSQGMKQKIGLCAALIHDPKILFLDEPTANLDPIIARIVKDMIKNYVSKTKKTVILTTHLLSIAEELCDELIIMNNGKVMAQGSSRSIISEANTKTLEQAFLKYCKKEI